MRFARELVWHVRHRAESASSRGWTRQPAGAASHGGYAGLVSMLDRIVAGVLEDLEDRRRKVSIEELKDRVDAMPRTRDAVRALRTDAVTVIAEIKRASPSRGHLAEIADPASLARAYEDGGAAAISVLTEERLFGGCLDDLVAVRSAVDLPVLRKDFIFTSYQLFEARAAGADLVLLIVAVLDDQAMVSLIERAESMGLVALVEVRTEAELERALLAGARVVGVNSRNLHSMEVDRGAFARLAPGVPPSVVLVAESGVRGPADLLAYAGAGADSVLVGESIVTSQDPKSAVSDLSSAGVHPAARSRRQEAVRNRT